MNATFKPLALATAVAAATAGYAGATQAIVPVFGGNNLGDAAIVPYYSVQEGFISGIHIINTSLDTQVVKLRWRRAKDSMDALDFNLVMSPLDEWTGRIQRAAVTTGGESEIFVKTNDTTCTVPKLIDGIAPMGDLFREGAEEGYIEVIGMGSTSVRTPIGIASVHADKGPTKGLPVDCKSVESNFFRQATTHPLPVPVPLAGLDINGVYDSSTTVQDCSDLVLSIINPASQGCVITNSGASFLNKFSDTGNVLKVSYFTRDELSGLEFGSNAYHIQNLNNHAVMSNQEEIITNEKDYYSFLFPDLDGGSPAKCENLWVYNDLQEFEIREDLTDAEVLQCVAWDEDFDIDPVLNQRGRYNGVRATMGSRFVLNDWSTNSTTNTATDWVLTLPGQYLMLNLPVYVDFDAGDVDNCYNRGQAAAIRIDLGAGVRVPATCDARDLPVEVEILFNDREEQSIVGPDGGLVISPQTSDRPSTAILPYEVNVIQWTDGSLDPILGSDFATTITIESDTLTTPNGWATLSVEPDQTVGKIQGIIDYTEAGGLFPDEVPFDFDVVPAIPMVGFVAWERSFPSDPSANYGRLVNHSFTATSGNVSDGGLNPGDDCPDGPGQWPDCF